MIRTILFAALMLAPVPAAAQQAPAPGDAAAAQTRALAMRKQLEAWRGTYRIEADRIGCKTVKLSGDPRLDVVGCRAIQYCYALQFPAITKVEESQASAADKKLKVASLLAAAQPCLLQSRNAAIDVLAGVKPAPKALQAQGPKP